VLLLEIKIRYSKHAEQRKIEKGISDNEVKLAIQRGTKTQEEGNKVLAALFDLKIVYVKIGDVYYIITIIN